MKKKNCIFSFFLILFISILFAQKSPDKFFGKKIGADKTLIMYPEIIKYLKHLDQTSTRIKLNNEGFSTLKNPIYLVLISSEKNINNIEQLKKMNKKLANPDKITKEEAKSLIHEAKVFVLITATLHSTEIAASQMAMSFAYKLSKTDDPKMKEILNNVVILLMPSINPDGNIMVTEWYKKYLNTEYEGCRMPYLYHHYAGHDNNRDYYMLNLKESRVVNAVLHHTYFPHIYLDMHQMGSTGPRMFVPPFKDPLNQNLDPLLLRETDIIGTFMSLKLQENDKKGVASGYAFDAYWPGGTKNTAWFKNVVGILTELASVKLATPVFVEHNELRVSSKGLPEYKRQVNFPDPWQGGWWRLKDIIDYEMIAVEALIEVASKNRESFISNFYKFGKKCIKKGETEAPSAYIFPGQLANPGLYTFLEKMKEHGVRIYQLQDKLVFGNKMYSKGCFIILLNQPYRSFIKVMMEKQQYPEIKHMRGGPIIEPYDSSGWTLPLLMGVKYDEINVPFNLLSLSIVKKIDLPEEKISGSGGNYRIPALFNNTAIVINRLQKKGIPVYRAPKIKCNIGDFIVKNADVNEHDLKSVLRGTGVSVYRIVLGKKDNIFLLKPARLAIYQSYRASMDEGWTRWVLDNYEFPYTVLHNKDFKDKKFPKKYDTIIFPDISRDAIIDGKYRGYYSRSTTNMPPEYRGGIGKTGLKNLKNFIKQGGSIILLDSSAEMAIKDLSLPLINIMKNVKRDEFYCPGSILKIKVNPNDPLSWGIGKESILFFSRSLAFKTRTPSLNHIDRRVAAEFNDVGPHLLSGYLKGGNKLNRAAIIIRFKYFKGNVIILGGRVQHRAQTYATFKFLFNSIYYSGLKK